jgi:coenzyme F420-reducing hydrogenase alpha subunit
VKVDAIARVEGEGALRVTVEGREVVDVELRIYEPPRFFEALLVGRRYDEAPDITSRICGICPIAYQMAAVHAMEQAMGVTVGGALRELRRLIYCGEWVESHVLHIALLHAPDFLGYDSAIDWARDHPDTVRLALELKKVGNDVMRVVGGREIHPINVRVGGFYRIPPRVELLELREPLKRALESAVTLARLVSGFAFPDLVVDHELVALRHATEYPLNEGRVVSSAGLDIDVAAYEDHFTEEHVARSTALHSVGGAGGGLVSGPLARYATSSDLLTPFAQQLARECGLGPVCRNPHQSIVVRAVEVAWALEEALRILDEWEPPPAPAVVGTPQSGRWTAATEAPRGLLYHRYDLDERGIITGAVIVPPTARNQAAIERDLRVVVSQHLDLADESLAHHCERVIRSYDPCISCATHFLRFTTDRVDRVGSDR